LGGLVLGLEARVAELRAVKPKETSNWPCREHGLWIVSQA
jgi:hypothetical protein